MIVLTREEGLDLLSALEEAAEHLAASRVYALVIQLTDGVRLLVDKLFPGLPSAE